MRVLRPGAGSGRRRPPVVLAGFSHRRPGPATIGRPGGRPPCRSRDARGAARPPPDGSLAKPAELGHGPFFVVTHQTPVLPNPDPEHTVRAGRSVRDQLALFAFALLLPIFLFSAFVLWRYAETERSRLEADAGESAAAIATALDRELTGVFASLDVLSTSAYLEQGDFAGFYGQAKVLMERQGIVTVLTGLDGQQLVNIRVPSGTPLPRSILSFDKAVLAGGRPFATDLITGQVTGTKQFLAVVPVRVEGQLRYVLYFSLPLARLQQIIADADIPAAYTASIVDRADVIMARSKRAEDFVGKPASADLVANTTGRSGTWSGTTADGARVFASYTRSRLSDFRAVIGIRHEDLDAPIWRSLALFLALFTVVAAFSVLLAVVIGRRITGPLSALSREAARLGRRETVQPISTGLREANAVGTVIAEASTRLRDREHALREANDEIQRFAYIVSHDLRSPLVNIMGFTTELEAMRGDIFGRLADLRRATAAAEGGPDDELGRDFDEAIGFIKTSIAKMDRLINAILALSREDRRPFQPVEVDMDGLVSGIAASLKVQTDRADATVTARPLPSLVGDRLALEQIFSNLMDNALKYLRNGVPGRVQVGGETRGRSVVYTVIDNGRGVDPKDRERIFDLFRRSGVQDRPGEGIGLAHVRALVRRLGGTISLTSEPGQGSTFTVTLPRRPAGASQREAA